MVFYTRVLGYILRYIYTGITRELLLVLRFRFLHAVYKSSDRVEQGSFSGSIGFQLN